MRKLLKFVLVLIVALLIFAYLQLPLSRQASLDIQFKLVQQDRRDLIEKVLDVDVESELKDVFAVYGLSLSDEDVETIIRNIERFQYEILGEENEQVKVKITSLDVAPIIEDYISNNLKDVLLTVWSGESIDSSEITSDIIGELDNYEVSKEYVVYVDMEEYKGLFFVVSEENEDLWNALSGGLYTAMNEYREYWEKR